MKKYLPYLLVIVMLKPVVSLKAQYHAGDSTICYNLMTNNFAATNQLNWNDPDPGNWLGVVWNSANPRRITHLNLHGDGNSNVGVNSTYPGSDGMNFLRTYPGFANPGVNSMMVGAIDLTGLSELFAFDFRRHDSIESVNVNGLTKLEYARFSRTRDTLRVLDFSNLPNLQHLDCGRMDSLKRIDVSNCPRLKVLKANRSNVLDSVNIAGSDSIEYIVFCRSDDATHFALDVTGKTRLTYLKVKRSGVTALTGINTCSSLEVLKAGKNSRLRGTFDFAAYNAANLNKFSVGESMVDSVNNWGALSGNPILEVVNVGEARLTLSNAVQIANEVVVDNKLKANDQFRWGGDTIYVGDMIDFPGEDTIDINGTNVASTFTLFDGTGAQVMGGTNQTGIFVFPYVTDTGAYYVEMNNPGAAPDFASVDLVTDTFWVLECPVLDTSTTVDSNTITVNQVGATYRWINCSNNTIIPGATNQSYMPLADGSYAVEITFGGVCVDTSACVDFELVGIEDVRENNAVSVFPNPMNEQVTISLEKAVKHTQVLVVNVAGKVIYTNIVNTNQLVIDGSDWNNGIYIVRIMNDEYTKTLKLIK